MSSSLEMGDSPRLSFLVNTPASKGEFENRNLPLLSRMQFLWGVKRVDPISLRPNLPPPSVRRAWLPSWPLAPPPDVVIKPRPYAPPLPVGAPGWNRPALISWSPQTRRGRGRGGAGGRSQRAERTRRWGGVEEEKESVCPQERRRCSFQFVAVCFSTTDWQAFCGSAPRSRATERSFPISGLETAKPPKMAHVGLTWLSVSPLSTCAEKPGGRGGRFSSSEEGERRR